MFAKWNVRIGRVRAPRGSAVRKGVMTLAVALLVLGGSAILGTGAASASKPEGHEVTLCHFTNENSAKPYHSITVDVASAGNNGSTAHEGDPKDIIPPYTYGNTDYPGSAAWQTPEGKAILANGCQVPTTVTPGLVTLSQSQCVSGAATAPTLTMPSTTGISYSASPSGPYQAGQQVTVTAEASSGYWFQEPAPEPWTFVDLSTETYTVTFDAAPDCAVAPETVTPAAPTASDASCQQQNMTVTLPAEAAGVDYVYEGSLTLAPGESVTITAKAKDGYALADNAQTSWTFTNNFDAAVCSPEPQTVAPGAPTASDASCQQQNMTVTLPSEPTGVDYVYEGSLTLAPGESLTVTAKAKDGYVLAEDATTSWTFTNDFDTTTCTQAEAVTAGDPTFAEMECANGGLTSPSYTVTEETGVEYSVDGQAVDPGVHAADGGSTVTIEATAKPGYVLTGDTEWTHTFADAPTNCGIAGEHVVRPLAPTASTATCSAETVSVRLPNGSDAVSYTADGPLVLKPGRSVTVTAHAADGYTLAGGPITTRFTNRLDLSKCRGVLPEGPTPSSGGGLAYTGAGPINGELGWAIALITLGGLTLLFARKRKAN